MTASTLTAIRERLVDVCGGLVPDVPAYSSWPGVEQVWADVGGSHFERVEAYWLDDNATVTVTYPTLRAGQKRREEEIDQIVCAGVQDAAETATIQAVKDRVHYLFGELEHALAATGRLSGATLVAGQQILLARIDEWTTEAAPLESAGFAAVVTARVLVRARIL